MTHPKVIFEVTVKAHQSRNKDTGELLSNDGDYVGTATYNMSITAKSLTSSDTNLQISMHRNGQEVLPNQLLLSLMELIH